MWWLLVPAAVSVLLIGGAWYAYGRAFFSFRKQYNYRSMPQHPEFAAVEETIQRMIDGVEAQEITRTFDITAYDGIRLHARYYEVQKGAPLHIQMHGYRSHGYRDFSSGTALGKEVGYNILMVDQRAHGQSGGRSITFGIREKWDCKVWAEFAAKEFGEDTPIFLSGVSMGAATVLMAADLDICANIVGIFADCPYSSPEAIIRKVCAEDLGLPVGMMYPFVQLGAFLFGRFRIRGGAQEAVKHTDIPILLIHGEADEFVPCNMSREIAAAGKTVQLHTFPKAGHGLSFLVDRDRYCRLITEFTNQCLKGK